MNIFKNFAIACGGTGGHISPGIAISEELQSRGHKAILVISKKSIDSTMLKKYKQFDKFIISANPLTKKLTKISDFIFSQISSFFKCIKFIKNKKIDVVIGFGGFTNLPLILAAFVLRKKIFLHEANQIVGKSIKILSFLADKVFMPQGTQSQFLCKKSKLIESGYPLRKEISKLAKADSRKQLNLDPDKFTLLVFGGSQGAKTLTNWVETHTNTLSQLDIQTLCICGDNHVKADCDNIIFMKFCDNMSLAYSCADIIVSRAGAGTIAEIQNLQVPTILIPFPFAAHMHQHANAQRASEICGFITIDQKSIKLVLHTINEIKNNQQKLAEMQNSFANLSNVNWSKFITETIEQIIC